MDFADELPFRVLLVENGHIFLDVSTGMSVMLNLGCLIVVIIVPQFPGDIMDVATFDIDVNMQLPMQDGDFLEEVRDWFLNGLFLAPVYNVVPEQYEIIDVQMEEENEKEIDDFYQDEDIL